MYIPIYIQSKYTGGLGFSSSDIGIVLSLMGCVTLFMQLVVYPQISRMLNPLELYKLGVLMYVFIFPMFPVISTFVAQGELKAWTWSVLILNMACRQIANVLSFTSVMIMVSAQLCGTEENSKDLQLHPSVFSDQQFR
jgi:hypothetical protein